MLRGRSSMTNEAKKRLLDVIHACEAIAEFVAGKDFAGGIPAYEQAAWPPIARATTQHKARSQS